jgi:NADH dehydrogenase
MNDRILLLGGTGFVGRQLCSALVERSGGAAADLLVPSRHPERAKHLQSLPTVRLSAADVHDEAQLTTLLRGRDAVVNLVAILHGSDAAFERTHVELPRKLVRACAAAGVRRVVHVSALGVGPNAPSRYLRSKTAGEAVLRAAGLDLTVLRPSVIFGAHDRFLNLFAQLQSVFPVMPLAGAQARFQPVWVGDVAGAIARALVDDATIGSTYECAGPQVYTLRQLVEAAGRWSGHPRPVIGLPAAMGRLQALAMELLPGEPLMSRDNLASMQVPNVATGQLPGLAALGITPASLDSVGPTYLSPGRGPARLDAWRARRGR